MTVIHRDLTFKHDGRCYALVYGGRGWGYEIVTLPDRKQVADGFHTLADVREYVDKGFLDLSGRQ